jgi:hypothetical protein|tara:strand:- start:57 stop:200 length:144 start_codon:yes stop_codon:yes gene_type:complete
MKKKKLNSKNPKYMDNSEVNIPKVKERKLINNTDGVKIYAIKYENTN